VGGRRHAPDGAGRARSGASRAWWRCPWSPRTCRR
jgi:hypothetical protein